jgi:hypothetical protein
MSDMLESRLVLELRRHHLRFDRSVMRHPRSIIIIVIIHIFPLSTEIRRSFMFVCSSILETSAVFCPRRRKHTYWYLVKISPISLLEYSYNFLLLPKIITATSTEQSTESSCAFLNKPPLRFKNVLQTLAYAAAQPKRRTPTRNDFDHP